MTFKSSVSRGKSQVLFNYLPGALIDFPTAEVVTKVLSIGSTRSDLKSNKRILDKIYPIIKSGKYASIDEAFPETPNTSYFHFGEPKFVRCEIYPLVFSGERDNVVHFFNSVEELENFIEFNWNGERLKQRDLVFITKEGDLDRLHPTVNARNRRIRLVKIGETQAGFHWVDANTGEDLGQIYHIINKKRVSVATPVRAKITHIPQILTLVNIRDYIETENETDKNKLALLILAKYLGFLDNIDLTIEQCMRELRSSPNFQAEDKMKQMLSILKIKMESLPEETKNKLTQAAADTMSSKIAVSVNLAKEKTIGINLGKAYENVYEYVETAYTKNKMTIDNVLKSSEGAQLSKFIMFERKLNTAGIKTAIFIEDVPLIHVAYGYTRGSFISYETKLRAFAPDVFEKEKIPIYLNPVNTEGLLLVLDRYKIITWLKDNGLINDELPLTEEEQKLWFLKNINPEFISIFSGTVKEGITKEVFHLVHTISHSLIKQIPEQCGIGLDSIGEIIFPSIPAILIYSKEGGEFRIGALKDLFENKIYPWIDITAKNVNKCVYDPVCTHDIGACHSCLFIHEVSCAFFNQDLSRHYLIGHKTSKITRGFWEDAIANL